MFRRFDFCHQHNSLLLIYSELLIHEPHFSQADQKSYREGVQVLNISLLFRVLVFQIK